MIARNRLLKALISLALCLTFLPSTNGKTEPKRFHQYVQDRWSIEDGLLQVVGAAIAQDSEGYIWIGSQVGLSRFDGVKFDVFSEIDHPDLNGYITFLKNDSKGRLWIGTYKSVVVYEHGIFRKISRSDLASEKIKSFISVREIIELPNQDILLSTNYGLLKIVDTTIVLPKDWHHQSSVYGILYHDNQLWSGGVGEVTQYTGNQYRQYSLPDGDNSVIVNRIVYYNNTIWLGTSNGVYYLNDEAFVKYTENITLEKIPVESMLVDSRDELWIGTNTGIFRIVNGQFYEHVITNELKVIRTIIEDHENNLWFGTYVHGIARVHRGLTYNYGPESGLTDPLIWSVYRGSEDDLWIGTNNGLNHFDNEKFTLEISPEELPNPVIYTLLANDDEIVLGTRAGAAIYRDGKVVVPEEFFGLMHSHIRSIINDGFGGYFFGTDEGLFHYHNEQLHAFNKDNNGVNVSFRYITLTSDNRLLLGGEHGLFEFKNEKLYKIFPQSSENEGLDITFIFENEDGSLIVGTSSQGLLYFKDGAWSHFNKKFGGLPTPGAYFITKDNRDYIWVSSFNGLYRFHVQNIENFLKGTKESLETEFILDDIGRVTGAQKSDCCTGAGTAKGLLDDNMLILPSRRGLIKVDTNDISVNSVAPKTYVEQVNFSGKWFQTKTDEKLELSAEHRDIIIEFTTLSFQSPKIIKIEYQLKGYDDEWKSLNDVTKRLVSYTNLPAGDYQFLVRGSNNSGIWGHKPGSFSFSISPYFYETWWFYLILMSSIIYFSLFWNKRRLALLENQRIILEKEVKGRTEELRVANKKLVEISTTDPLTGLRNRRYLHEQLPKDLSYLRRLKASESYDGKAIVFMMIDIDHFKRINDRYGHYSGDDVIKCFSAILIEELRNDDYVIRWGGEEFLVVLRPMNREAPEIIADRLCKAVRNYDFSEELDSSAKITTSIGYASLPFFTENDHLELEWEEVVEIADRALYMVKQNGRDGWATYHAESLSHNCSLKDLNNFEMFRIKNNLELTTSWMGNDRRIVENQED